jgi:hypothetical protein
MKHLAVVLFLASVAWAQAPATNPVSTSGPPVVAVPVVVLPAPTMLPSFFVSGGGGYAVPGGKLAYASASSLELPQQTYVTIAVEYTMVKGHLQPCELAGLSKPLYQVGPIVAGLTGLGGSCTGPTGKTTAVGYAQPFVYIPWGPLPVGNIVTFMKNTDGSGWKFSLGFTLKRN